MKNHSVSRRLLLSFVAVAASISLPAAYAQSDVSGPVVLYTSLNAQSVEAATDMARKVLPKVKVNAVTGGSVPLLKRMETEAAKPQGDVFWTSSANLMANYPQLFEAYKSPEAAAIPASLHEPKNLWVAANIHVVVAMLNTKRLEGPAPQTWADLTDPRRPTHPSRSRSAQGAPQDPSRTRSCGRRSPCGRPGAARRGRTHR